MCDVRSFWLSAGLTPATSPPLHYIMPGSPGANEQFSECRREREWAPLLTSKSDFSPSPEERKVRWGWRGGRTSRAPLARTPPPSTALHPSQQRFCSSSVSGKWSLVTALWTDCSRLAISVKHGNKYKAPGRSSSERSPLISRRIYFYITLSVSSLNV